MSHERQLTILNFTRVYEPFYALFFTYSEAKHYNLLLGLKNVKKSSGHTRISAKKARDDLSSRALFD